MTKHRKIAPGVMSVLLLVGLIAGPIGAVQAEEGLPQRPAPAAPSRAMPDSIDANAMDLLGSMSAADAVSDPLQAGGDRLVEMQQNDGGWDWPLDDGDPDDDSPKNTVGPIAMGLAQAYLETDDANHLAALENAGDFLLAKTNDFSPSDGYLAAQLDEVFDVTTYTVHVKTNFYDKLAAGTYDRKGEGTLYDTEDYVQHIRDYREGITYDGGYSQANMAAWDVGMGLVGAASCGVTTTHWISGTKAEIDELDGDNYYDVIGLAGALYGLAFVDEAFDPSAGEHASASSLDDLASILASYQIDGGGFTWNSNYVIPNDGNEAIQETSYAILALSEVDLSTYLANIKGAADYMMDVQLDTGGWENYVGGSTGENNEVTGEALWGISTVYQEQWAWVEVGDPGWLAACEDEEITADVLLTADGFNGVEFKLTFDWAELEVTDVSVGSMWSPYSSTNLKADYTSSSVEFASYLQDTDTNISVNGAQVATITFKQKGTAGDLDILFDYIIVSNTDGETILDAGYDTTLEVKPCGCVQGNVELQGRFVSGGDTINHEDASVTLSGGPGGRSYGGFTDANGDWTICEVVEGSYDVAVDMDLYLSAKKTDPVSASSGSTDAGFVKLLGGDCNLPGNDIVGSGDAAVVANTFGLKSWQDGYDDNGDINDDNQVNILDCSILGGNYGKEGPVNW